MPNLNLQSTTGRSAASLRHWYVRESPVAVIENTTSEPSQAVWLAGCWERVDSEPGSGEFWPAPAGDSLFGVSHTVRDGRTVAFEFMQIRRADEGAIELIAHPSGQAVTTFRLIDAPGHKAVFENPTHDFPQRVIYQLRDAEHLDAWIEGVDAGEFQRIDFPLVRSQSAALCPCIHSPTDSSAEQAAIPRGLRPKIAEHETVVRDQPE